jgi:predicted enzyme related to lactoylglutathione lyase
MKVSVGMVSVDALDPRNLAQWWANLLDGSVVEDAGDGVMVVVELPAGPRLGFQKVAEPTPGKNRIHLDLYASEPDQVIKTSQEAGARVLRRHETAGYSWVVLEDIEGNQFCIAPHKDA